MWGRGASEEEQWMPESPPRTDLCVGVRYYDNRWWTFPRGGLYRDAFQRRRRPHSQAIRGRKLQICSLHFTAELDEEKKKKGRVLDD